jgi:hypothetical protein
MVIRHKNLCNAVRFVSVDVANSTLRNVDGRVTRQGRHPLPGIFSARRSTR